VQVVNNCNKEKEKEKEKKDLGVCHISDVGLLNAPSHAQHYWVWYVDMVGGPITGSPMDFGEAVNSGTILDFYIESNSFL
jgi:hypothetical protein